MFFFKFNKTLPSSDNNLTYYGVIYILIKYIDSQCAYIID